MHAGNASAMARGQSAFVRTSTLVVLSGNVSTLVMMLARSHFARQLTDVHQPLATLPHSVTSATCTFMLVQGWP